MASSPVRTCGGPRKGRPSTRWPRIKPRLSGPGPPSWSSSPHSSCPATVRRSGRTNSTCADLSGNRAGSPWRSERLPRPSSVGDTDELELLVVTGDHPLGDLADPRLVVLLLGLRLQWAAFAGDEQMGEAAVRHGLAAVQPEHPGLVERLSGRVVLLPVGVPRLRGGRHDDAGLAAVDAGQPGVAGLDQLAV